VSALTPSRLDGLNILIVDDHQDTVDMFVAYLVELRMRPPAHVQSLKLLLKQVTE
jgi:hypothetical protein